MQGFPRPFGKYTLLAALGRGGMGEVFAARVTSMLGIQKLCVIKTVSAHVTADREAVARFLDEARLVVQLNQKNICSVFDVGIVDGQHFLAMDMVRGRDVRTIWNAYVARHASVDLALALEIMIEVLEGLDYAHRLADPATGPLHIVHRDVSPQNVMVSFDGDVKLIDFGLAASTLKLEKTESNVVLGKVAYMPPEQLRGEALDRRADLFAVGVMLYELVSGERYYEGVPPLMLASAAALGSHRPLSWDRVDDTLRSILARALAPRREDRIESAAIFAEELRAYAASRQLRGGSAGLRAMMVELFGDPREAWETSGDFLNPATLELPRPAERTEVAAPEAHAFTASMSAPVEDTPGTERMRMSAPAPRPRRAPVMLAGAALIAMAAVGGVLLSRASDGGGDGRAPTTALLSGDDAGSATNAALVTAHGGSAAGAAGNAASAADDRGATTDVEPSGGSATRDAGTTAFDRRSARIASSDADAGVSPRSEPEKGDVVDGDAAPKPRRLTTPKRGAKSRADAPPTPTTIVVPPPLAAARYVREKCPELRCSKELAKKRDLQIPEERQRFVKETERCYRECVERR